MRSPFGSTNLGVPMRHDRFGLTRFAAFVAGLLLLLPVAQAAEPLRIGVIGATGMIGQRVVDEALRRGHDVTAVVRDPGKVTRADERMRVVRGDVLDRERLATVLADLDVVVSAVGTGRAPDADGSIYLAAAQSLVEVLRARGDAAPRLIVVGGVGSLALDETTLVVERVAADRHPEHYGQKAALDFLRTVTDVRWTYLSPPAAIAPGTRTGQYRVGRDELLRDAAGKPASISMEDYAVALIDEAETGRHVRARFTVAN